MLMPRTIRLQSDSNAHDRPWRVAVERGYFADEGLDVEYHEDNPNGVAGRVENFSERWKESQLQKGALEVYPVCEWGAIERVQTLGKGKIIGLDTTVRTGALGRRVAQCADRRDLARGNVLRRHRGTGSRRRAVRRHQARPRQ
jgi:NMT1/THI5 like